MLALDRILTHLDSYKGRDRFLRLLCYSSKCAAGLVKSPERASQLDNFSKQLSTSRACFRLLDDLPVIVEIIRSSSRQKEKTTIEKVVSTVETFVDVIFGPLDHISWAIDHKIIISNSTIWDTGSTLCWVISLYINLFNLFRKISILSNQKLETSNIKQRELNRRLSEEQFRLELSALKCMIDLLFAVNYLPKGMLWAQFFNKWQVGALGSFSSLVSLYQSFRF